MGVRSWEGSIDGRGGCVIVELGLDLGLDLDLDLDLAYWVVKLQDSS